jgi:DDE superfamily endonuclease
LADKLVELRYVDGVSYETVRQVLKKNELKPWLSKRWCIPPQAQGEFVWRMEDVLEVYTRPYDPWRPLVCLDEVSKQLINETRRPQPAKPGRPSRFDYEYRRGGVANIFLWCEPLRGQRHTTVTERRTRVDWAHVIKDLVDVRYPEAEKVVLVQDSLNTHTPGSLYETFPPTEAKRLADKLEIHSTPKHGSWLNIAEIELSTMAGQCLDRRIPDRETLEQEVAAWEAERNALGGRVNWQFTTDAARIKLKRLYLSIQP